MLHFVSQLVVVLSEYNNYVSVIRYVEIQSAQFTSKKCATLNANMG